VDLPGMGAGLVAAGLLLTGAVWLRRHRWEI
jgi:high-affinity Fe2+/Pb2+ permease